MHRSRPERRRPRPDAARGTPRRPRPSRTRGLAFTVLLAPITAAAATVPTVRVSYAAPPARGDVVVAQPELVRCDSARGARYTAATGFFAADCAAAPRTGRWRVLACRHVALADGGLWLVEAVALDGGPRVWLPLPWHDWA